MGKVRVRHAGHGNQEFVGFIVLENFSDIGARTQDWDAVNMLADLGGIIVNKPDRIITIHGTVILHVTHNHLRRIASAIDQYLPCPLEVMRD